MPFRDRRAYDAARKGRQARTPAVRKRKAERDKARKDRKADRYIVGIDGEGKDTPDGRHVYTYLCAVNEHGTIVAEAENQEGLSHEECATMLLSIPRNSLKFGYSFSYDVTMMIEDMPDAHIYYLMHPQARRARLCRECKCKWRSGEDACPDCGSNRFTSVTMPVPWRKRKYNFFNGSFSIDDRKGRSVKVWDCFRFFGCSFVQALTNWKVGTEEQVKRISDMKAKRGAFDTESPEEVKRYCQEECHLLALMMRKLIDAHIKAGIELKRYEGAGSTASALLSKFEVEKYKGPPLWRLPPDLQIAILSAFFGGRFENSSIGLIEEPIQSSDIASAYPYAQTFHPCLACGTWRKEKRVPRDFSLALVKYHVKDSALGKAWAPLPCRDEKGSICYGANFTGWAWYPEYRVAREFDCVEPAGEVWVYDTNCDHKPFGFLPAIYKQRLAWGKEGAGLTLKLGSNASYGKTAQTLGEDPPFQSFIWAGMTTNMCRAQLLTAILRARDPWSVIAVATDGIYATEKLMLPEPRDTGTFGLVKSALGGWEQKDVPEGAFFAKPGLYFRLSPELDDVRARGVGRKEVYARRDELIQSFLKWNRKDFEYAFTVDARRFYGAKTCILARSACTDCGTTWPGVPAKRCPMCQRIGNKWHTEVMRRKDGKPAYGTWDLREIRVAFDPYPKRQRKLKRGGTSTRLLIRDLEGAVSVPYRKGLVSAEALAVQASEDFALEQPDWSD